MDGLKLERCEAGVVEYVAAHPGCRRSELSVSLPHGNGQISGAVARLLADGRLVERGKRHLYVADLSTVCGECGRPR